MSASDVAGDENCINMQVLNICSHAVLAFHGDRNISHEKGITIARNIVTKTTSELDKRDL